MRKYQKKAWIDLKKLRTERGWLQWEVAEKLGVSREYISAIENGKRGISMRMMEMIIQEFHIKYEEFYRTANPDNETFQKES